MNFKSLLDFKSLKSFDWRSLQRYTSPQAAADLNAFLEKMPVNVGQNMLIIAGITWAAAGAIGLYTTIQLRQLTELRNSLQEATALKPIVPIIKKDPVAAAEVTTFVDNTSKVYEAISIKANGSSILVSADNTAAFGQFREVIGHIQNGGSGWQITMDRLCVGRECDQNPLAVSLKINKVSVEKPGI